MRDMGRFLTLLYTSSRAPGCLLSHFTGRFGSSSDELFRGKVTSSEGENKTSASIRLSSRRREKGINNRTGGARARLQPAQYSRPLRPLPLMPLSFPICPSPSRHTSGTGPERTNPAARRLGEGEERSERGMRWWRGLLG